MLRFLSERRAKLVAALAALALGIAILAWALGSLPGRAASSIASRLGVDAEVRDVAVSFGGVALRGLTLRGRSGGVDVRIDEAHADVNPLWALFRGARAVRAMSAHGVDVQVDLGHEGAAQSIESIRERVSGSGSGSAASGSGLKPGGRTVEVSGLQVTVVDAAGPLLSAREVSLSKRGDEARAKAAETLLGERASNHAYVAGARVELRREGGAWRLHALAVDEGSLRSLRDHEGAKRPLALRIRDLVAIARPAKTQADSEASAEPNPSSARWFRRLTPDADIDVANVQLESRTSDYSGRPERIEGFTLSIDGFGDGAFRVVAGGETSNRGTLDVDLKLTPSEARAEGSVELRRLSLALVAPFLPDLPLTNTEVGTFSAELDLDAASTDRVAIDGVFQVSGLALESERIAAEPIQDVTVRVRGRGAWLPELRRLEIDSAQVRMGKASVFLEGEVERTPEHYRADLVAKLPPTDCNDVVGAIPEDVLRSLSRFAWSGNWSSLVRLSLDSRDLEATELSIRVRNLCQFEQTPRWVRVERFQEPFRHRAVEPDETVFEMTTGPGTDNWVPFAEISPFVAPAVISHEDGGFYDHGGFAPWAIRDALVRNLQEGRYVVGASTISMQLAKNLYLQREKTIARKVQEVILTWWLENALTKEEILELYLNIIEYGPSVYGLRHAAAYYFGRAPSELSPAESAFLACVLPSPKRYYASYERGALTRSMKNRTRRLLEHMAKRERIGPEALAYGLAELDDFRFHRGGDPPPAPRALPPLGAPEEVDPTALDPFEALFMAP